MMAIKLVLLLSLAAVALCRPQDKPPVPIVSQESNLNPDGSYNYAFETGDGTKAEQTGEVRSLGEDVAVVARGSYSFVAADGVTYTITYVADENGFQPQGDHLAPIPEAIARSIEYNKAHPEENQRRK